MPTLIINTAQSFSSSLKYASGNGIDKLAQSLIKSMPATSAEGLVDGFEEGRRARMISTNLSGKNVKKLAKQLDKIAKQRQGVEKPVLLIKINLKPGENLEPHQTLEMIDDCRRELKLENCPFTAFEHRDKPHQHFHIIFSVVDFNGQIISSSHNRLQARTWARRAEIKYNLTLTPQRSPRRLMTGDEYKKFERDGTHPSFVRMQNCIDENLQNTAGDFVELMEEKNVGVIVYFKDGKPFGIGFATTDKKYAGGKLGTEFSWGGLIARGMDYQPARDDKKLIAAARRSLQKFPVQTVVPKKLKLGKIASSLLDKSGQKLEQQTDQNSQVVQPINSEKTSEQPVEISSREEKIQIEKPTGKPAENLPVQISKSELAKVQNFPVVPTQPKITKQVDAVAPPNNETQNPAYAISEITPLETDDKLSSSNRVADALSEEQIDTLQELVVTPEGAVIGEIRNGYDVEKTTVKTTEERVLESSNKLAVGTDIVSPVLLMSEIKGEVENLNSKPKIRDFAIVNREQLIAELANESNEESKRWTGAELSYPQQKNLKALYRIQGENKPTFKQVMELKVLQKNFKEPLLRPTTFFEASVIKLDNSTEAEKSEILRRQIEYVNKDIELKESQKAESETRISPTEETKTAALLNSVDDSSRMQKEMEQRGFMSPLAAPSNHDELVPIIRAAELLQKQIKQSLKEQGIELKPPAQTLLNDRVDGWANELPTAEENRKIDDIFKNVSDRLKPGNRLETVSLIFARTGERERDEISFTLGVNAKADAEKALSKEINHREITSLPSLSIEKSAANDGSPTSLTNINSGNQTIQSHTDEYRKRLLNEIVRISRESAAKQAIKVSAPAWEALEAEFTNDAAGREASQTQKEVLDSLQKAIPKEEQIAVKRASRLEAAYLTLKFSPADYRDEFVRKSLVNYEKTNDVAERQNFIAREIEKSPIAENIEISTARINAENVEKIGSRATGYLPQSNKGEIKQAEQKFTAQMALHRREIAESRIKDFDSIHENAERQANLVARQQKEKNNALTMNAVSEIWKRQYNGSYQMQWENNRNSRISRRENEIREAVAIGAKITLSNQTENKERTNENKTETEILEKTSVNENVAFLMRSVRQANEEWMDAEDTRTVEPLSPQTERLMQFFIERDKTLVPESETLRTANFIAEMNRTKAPEFTDELNAKVWIMTNLPDTGKQLFLENYIEKVQSNASQMMLDMQTIQLNESMQIIRRQSEKLNQEINQTLLNQVGLNKMWQGLQQAANTSANSETIEVVRQFQKDNKISEIVTPLSKLDAIHTTLTKTDDSVRERNTNVQIQTIHNEVHQEELEVKAKLDAQLIEIKASETRVLKLE